MSTRLERPSCTERPKRTSPRRFSKESPSPASSASCVSLVISLSEFPSLFSPRVIEFGANPGDLCSSSVNLGDYCVGSRFYLR